MRSATFDGVTFCCAYRNQVDLTTGKGLVRLFVTGGETDPWHWHYDIVARDAEDADVARRYYEASSAEFTKWARDFPRTLSPNSRQTFTVTVDPERWEAGYYA